ncbi:DUF1156 domain-containing protein [Bradyrhizobium vignae]|uniref:DUF1156 domain-containing protein n=1 Tax=Bradyrhizobium vignae TaxID=1549949 RepID=A0ABS3ZXB4_9BRAD|nr:DUF1156 domain-containing protein [Bradyrhizobium vignae]MBP0112787.1 DUF1156 domain-containing protein [Bradyrhizobium vignae]
MTQDVRLIERWLPIGALGEESVRERRFSMAGKVLPPHNSLHVWWARRPLIASRAAILASCLPSSFGHDEFLRLIGINGDPVAARRRNDRAIRAGKTPLGDKEYGYPRAFKHFSDRSVLEAAGLSGIKVLDPTAGGGAIPFEAVRMGFKTVANDLNPVAALIEKATIEYPANFGSSVLEEFRNLAQVFLARAEPKFQGVFPPEPSGTQILAYIWARTIKCPYCDGLIPLSPNWKLSPDGTGIRVIPVCEPAARVCRFEIVDKLKENSPGTVSDGDATCPFPDCGRVIDGIEIKRQAQEGALSEQLVAMAFKRRVETKTNAGKRGRDRLERGFRAAAASDDNSKHVADVLESKMADWIALDLVPSESFPDPSNDDRPIQYGMPLWRDLFSPRQLLGHGLAVETYREMYDADAAAGISAVRQAAYVYLAFALDKFLNWNARLSSWNVKAGTLRSVFDRHDFAFKWSYAEMAPFIAGEGYRWVLEQVDSALEGLISLVSHGADERDLLSEDVKYDASSVTITCRSGDDLDYLPSGSIDVIVMDPPYYNNVMYAELSDFFYVWLKRTAGYIVPELFTRQLTDKENEAVASAAKFANQKGADALAGRDYQERMQRIFAECHRVIKPTGVMTLMFTHKATGAWDALTKGLMEAGFIISASWPVNTEPEGSLHIKDKAAANSTMFLVCRPRGVRAADATYWEDVEPLVAKAVRSRVSEFQNAGISGVDLYLACFGPALEEFSRHWPLKRGTPRPELLAKKRRKQAEFFEEAFDPYSVTPEDALEAARREVKTWRLNQLMNMRGSADLDPATSFYVLAWDAFGSPVFAYDEGLRLARAVGADLDQLIGRICEKKGSDIRLWDSSARSSKGALGGADGSRGMIDALQFAANLARTRSLEVARDFLKDAKLASDPIFLNSLEALLEVLPPSMSFSKIELTGDLKSASDDFDALEKLRRLAFADSVDEPKQLKLWAEEAA